MCEKKNVAGSWNGLLPIFSKCESQYSKLYCDTGLDKHGLGDRPGHAGACKRRTRSATIRPAGPRYRPRHSQQRARAWPGLWIVSRYTVLYHDRGEGLAAGGLCHDTVFVSLQVGSLASEHVTIQSVVS